MEAARRKKNRKKLMNEAIVVGGKPSYVEVSRSNAISRAFEDIRQGEIHIDLPYVLSDSPFK